MTELSTTQRRWSLVAAGLTVFLSNSVVMVVELVAGRVVSSFLGMSLYTWTAIIGVMMAGMSGGNFLGGWLADRFRPRRTLAVAFLLSAAAVVALLPLNAAVGEWQALRGLSWPMRIFCHIAIVFLMPGVFLGVINPVIAKMALNTGGAVGITIGRIFACGAAGSILGTFAAGYYLILAMGVHAIVSAMAAALGVLSVCYFVWSRGEARVGTSSAPSTVSAKPGVFAALGPSITVFVSNAAFMMLELAASRVVSRQFGSSLYTWTAVIGVVLAGVTAGNYAGGWIADRAASRKALSCLFICASVTSVAAAIGGTALGGAWDLVYGFLAMPWPLQIASFMTMAYFVPCFFIGTISPMVIRIALREDESAGRVVGAIYAWGLAGAILGTFATGYFLVAWLGMIGVILLVALVLCGMGLVYAPSKLVPASWAFAAGVIFFRVVTLPTTSESVVYKRESNYSYIQILGQEGSPDVRRMMLDKLVHSLVNLRDPLVLSYPYEWVYEGVLNSRVPMRAPVRTLVLGGGGFSFPHYLEVARPGSDVEVAEIDPAVTEAAHAAFGFPRDTTVKVFNMDARNRVEDLLGKISAGDDGARFDFVFGDSINDYSVPYHLTTREFARNVHAILKPDGVYMLNLIDVEDSGLFVSAAAGACRAAFEHVRVFNTLGAPGKRDTFVLVSSDAELDLSGVVESIRKTNDYSGRLLEPAEVDVLLARTGGVVLTDDYAPVENLLAPVAGTRQGTPAELRYRLARRYATRAWYPSAETQMCKALAERPSWDEGQAFFAWVLFAQGKKDEARAELTKLSAPGAGLVAPWVSLGDTRVVQGDLAEGSALLAAALELDSANVAARMKLADVARRTGHPGVAVEHWKAVLSADPKNVEALRLLGDTSATGQDLANAVGYWKRLLEIQPKDALTTHNLLSALAATGRNAEAAEVLASADRAGVVVDKTIRDRVEAAGRN